MKGEVKLGCESCVCILFLERLMGVSLLVPEESEAR